MYICTNDCHFKIPKVHKDDGSSESLCQTCWRNVKSFHDFYKRVEQILKGQDSDSVEKNCDDYVDAEMNSCLDLKTEEQTTGCARNVPSEPNLNVIKCEVSEEPTLEVIEIQISNDECPSDYNDDDQSNFYCYNVHCVVNVRVYNKFSFKGEPDDRTSDYEYPNADDLRESNAGDNGTLASNVQCNVDTEEEYLDESHESSSTSQCKKDTAKEDAQIREFFSMICEICSDVEFETFMKAKNHYRTVHNTVGYLTCCGKKFLRRGRVLDHIYRHLNPDAYRCDPCGKRFADKFALKNHIENHEPFNSRAYKCGLCASSFTKASKLAQHERIRHCSNEDKKFNCDKCKKK